MPADSDAVFSDVWEKYLSSIKPRVVDRAKAIAEADGRSELSAVDVFDALKEYVPGKPVSSDGTSMRFGWFNRNVTGFIGITAGLAIVFGLMGVVPFIKDVNKDYLPVASGFLEIAKIFAGAIVGGAAATAVKR
jgi:hypothetical protein